METIITYRRRSVTPEDVATIRRIIETPPDKSRRFIAQEVGREWAWRQTKGVLKAKVCRSLLLLWEAKGFIKRPAGKFIPAHPLAERKKPSRVTVAATPLPGPVADRFPLNLEQVRRTSWEKIFPGLVSERQDLGATPPVGEQLNYRENHLPLIANNLRFLIRPGVQVSCWVSYPLALNRRSVSPAGQDLYDPPVQRLETLVATQRYRGTGYPADHWIYVGPTTGQGKLSQSRQPLLSKKAVQVYPLTKNFRRELGYEV
jgi:hypothetical protein